MLEENQLYMRDAGRPQHLMDEILGSAYSPPCNEIVEGSGRIFTYQNFLALEPLMLLNIPANSECKVAVEFDG